MLNELLQRLARDGKIELMVRVRPHAAQSRFVDVLQDGSIKVDIAAPAEDGRGNVALTKFLAELFATDQARVKILSGKAARLKLVRIIAYDTRYKKQETNKIQLSKMKMQKRLT